MEIQRPGPVGNATHEGPFSDTPQGWRWYLAGITLLLLQCNGWTLPGKRTTESRIERETKWGYVCRFVMANGFRKFGMFALIKPKICSAECFGYLYLYNPSRIGRPDTTGRRSIHSIESVPVAGGLCSMENVLWTIRSLRFNTMGIVCLIRLRRMCSMSSC